MSLLGVSENMAAGAARLGAQGIRFTLSATPSEASALLLTRAPGPTVTPKLVLPEQLENKAGYKRFADLERKAAFREQLLDTLSTEWSDDTKQRFTSLVGTLADDGSLPLAGLVERTSFEQLIDAYQQALRGGGSRSFLHTFVNLGNHPDFLRNRAFNGAFLHPLLIALIAHRLGGPIRIVDARGKDAEPISVRAQDNMLHIDNTPFNDEYKVILSWKRGEPTGPVGQNFVFLPGTHKGVRAALTNPAGEPWSTENASIFITPKSIEQVFEVQKAITGRDPTVIEATHLEKPLTIAFAAGSLVHHRYRTREGSARSCVIVAFHRVADNPGALVSTPHGGESAKATLETFLLSPSGGTERFCSILKDHARDIEHMLQELADHSRTPERVDIREVTLAGEALDRWKVAATAAPTVSHIMAGENIRLSSADGERLGPRETAERLASVMRYDKHGPIDLILYADGHEEPRKWARNRIREMRTSELQTRLEPWASTLSNPRLEDVLEPRSLGELAIRLEHVADWMTARPATELRMPPGERIGAEAALRSLKQLSADLGEAIQRCDDVPSFVSTGLFLFWTADEMMRLLPANAVHVEAELQSARDTLADAGRRLLAHYVATKLASELQPQTP